MITTTIQKDYIKWLSQTKWDYFVTLTSHEPMKIARARRLTERLLDDFSKKYPMVSFFWVAEPFDITYGYHLHAIMSLPNLSPQQLILVKSVIHKTWNRLTNYHGSRNYNRVDIRPYDPTRKGVEYITKRITFNNADYDFYFGKK
jgi:hypothetical protein